VAPWPPLGSELREWSSSVDAGRLTVWERHRVEQPYRAAVVPHIAEQPVPLPSGLQVLQQDAAAEVARFDAEVEHLPVPMPAVLLRTESASSSQIEQLTSSARNIALAELGATDKANAALIVANTRAMQLALAAGDEVTADVILRAHDALLSAGDPDVAGRWRTEAVWVGASALSPHGADFVAPHHEHVPALIRDLTLFAARRDVPSLAHAALVHAQFETIHPFVDGNGRTGRVLVHTMMRRHGVAEHTTVPVSAGLLQDPGAYFDALGAYRAGDAAPIVERMSHAALSAVANGRELARDSVALRDRWREQITARRGAAAWRLADGLFARPVVDVRAAARITGTSERAALTAVDTLVEAGVLSLATGVRWGRVWQAREVLDAADAFARRAGRRRPGR
jgi:Fic family protein